MVLGPTELRVDVPREGPRHLPGELRALQEGAVVAVLAGVVPGPEPARGPHVGDPALDGPVQNALEMIDKLAKNERVEQVFVRHAFRFWMGRNETLNDGPVLQAAHKAYRESGGSMKALLVSLLTSDAFLYRKVGH